MVFHGLVRISGLRRPEVRTAVKAAWDSEPGHSVTHLHNAITRAAHQALRSAAGWPDEVEQQAGELLYRRHVLAEIPDEAREQLSWS